MCNNETFDVLYTKTIRQAQQLRNAGYNVIEKWLREFSFVYGQKNSF